MKKFILIGIIFSIVLVVTLLLTKKLPVEQVVVPTPTPAPSTYRGINLKTGTGNDIISLFGAPTKSITYGGVTTLIYPSSEKNRDIGIQINQGGGIRRVVEPVSSSINFLTVSAPLGKPDFVLYGKNEQLGFQLFVYLSQGSALLANPTTQQVQEAWYFPAMGGPEFLQTVGVGFTATHDTQKP